jgi:hypothetical protein
MASRFDYLRTLSQAELEKEYEKAEQADDIALAVCIMEEWEIRDENLLLQGTRPDAYRDSGPG